ncbi:MAG TPA: phosphodiester glycosidase family protein [Fimbriimonas sp.]|nr:phosphodiester glycosidase family protein [Fimbriimonas sp.]
MRLALSLLGALLIGVAPGQVWEKPIAPGLMLRSEFDAAAPRLIHALRITPGAPGLKLMGELAGGTINEEGTVKGRIGPSKIAQQAKAVAAINADFFSFDHGAPIGLMARNGELLTSPARNRAVFAWGEATKFGVPSFKASLTDENGLNLALDGINQPVGQNQLVLYTSAAGNVEISSENLMAFVKVEDSILRPNATMSGTVDYLLADSRKMTVPAGKVLLVARGTKTQALSALRPERKLRIRTETQGFDWNAVENAIGGGPFLLRNGNLAVDAEAQGFNAAFSNTRHPRTAVGVTKHGDIWLVAIDGRQSMSVGASLKETAEVMLGLGCVDAMNLDGGGSTNLHLLGVTVNRPSDKAERPVSNALLVFAPITSGSAPKIVVPERIEVGSTAMARLFVDQKEVPPGEVVWGMQGAGWIDQGGMVKGFEIGKGLLSGSYLGTSASTTIDILAVGSLRKLPVVTVTTLPPPPAKRTPKKVRSKTKRPPIISATVRPLFRKKVKAH